jgi:hypothetical protein
MLGDAPALVPAEVVNDHSRRLEGAIAIAERGPHAVVAEADQVAASVASEVGDEARMPVRSPTLIISQFGSAEYRRAEGSISGRKRGKHTVIAEAYNVGRAIAVEIGKQSQMLLGAPALIEAEVLKHEARCLKSAAAVGSCDPHTILTETDRISAAVTYHVGDQARVQACQPSLALNSVLTI